MTLLVTWLSGFRGRPPQMVGICCQLGSKLKTFGTWINYIPNLSSWSHGYKKGSTRSSDPKLRVFGVKIKTSSNLDILYTKTKKRRLVHQWPRAKREAKNGDRSTNWLERSERLRRIDWSIDYLERNERLKREDRVINCLERREAKKEQLVKQLPGAKRRRDRASLRSRLRRETSQPIASSEARD